MKWWNNKKAVSTSHSVPDRVQFRTEFLWKSRVRLLAMRQQNKLSTSPIDFSVHCGSVFKISLSCSTPDMIDILMLKYYLNVILYLLNNKGLIKINKLFTHTLSEYLYKYKYSYVFTPFYSTNIIVIFVQKNYFYFMSI